MISPFARHARVENVPRILVNGPRAIAPGAHGVGIAAGFFDSSEEAFHRIAPQLWATYCQGPFGEYPELASDFLVLIRKDNSADVYVGNIPKQVRIRAKRHIAANAPVTLKDMADITEQTFPKISIGESDSLIYCFRHAWRYGLFFDLSPGIGQPLDVIGLPRQLGHANRHVVFFDDYSAYRAAQNLGLIEDGWFPFIQLLGGEFRHLVDIYGQDDRDVLVDQFVHQYTGNKVAEIAEGWWKDELFASKREILLSGVEAFNSGTPSGAILCIKTFLSEIDGVVRLKFRSENIAMARPRQSALLEFIAIKASEKFDTYSPAFPEAFFIYLKDTIFADFDLAANAIPLSRHSAAHGVAAAETYTRARALQAILAMDQLFFYLAKTPESNDAK